MDEQAQDRYPREQCSSCGADIFRAPTEYRKQSVWDWTPREDGGYELHPDGRLIYVKRQPGDLDPRYVSHWATCPSADQHRREKRTSKAAPEDIDAPFRTPEAAAETLGQTLLRGGGF